MDLSAHHGKGFSAAERQNAICLDVLDAWFDPSPGVAKAYLTSLSSISHSPELDSESLRSAMAYKKPLPETCIGLGAGSSEIIHRVFGSRIGATVLVLDPTYSEYRFVASAKGAIVRSFALDPNQGFRITLPALVDAARGCDDVVLVNPNNPTGKYLTREEILGIRESLPAGCRLWIDEAYVDYCPAQTSVEQDASRVENLVVIKSLSKSFGLSGLRVAYWVGVNASSVITPPWAISQPGITCAVAALEDEEYYRPLWTDTVRRAEAFSEQLRKFGFETWAGSLNSVLLQLPDGIHAESFAHRLLEKGLVLRTPEGMGEVLDNRFLRISLPTIALEPLVTERLKSALS